MRFKIRRLAQTNKKSFIPKNKLGYLHIGSRLPVVDLQLAKTRRHTLVDPYFSSIGWFKLFFLKQKYPCFEFCKKTAHEFLDSLKEGVMYHTVRIDMPYEGIVDESSEFGSLCIKIHKILVPGGNLVILTDYIPNKEGVVHTFSRGKGADFVYNFLKGRELDELTEKEKAEIKENVKILTTANIVESLKKAGFDVRFAKTQNTKVIDRSETAQRRKMRGRALYLVIARKV